MFLSFDVPAYSDEGLPKEKALPDAIHEVLDSITPSTSTRSARGLLFET